MSWLAGSLLSTRERFVLAALAEREPFAQLCRRFHIARSTGYKWRQRFRRLGCAGLRDRSRRPPRCPRQLTPRWQRALRQLRRGHPTWGPRKLHARLRHLHPRVRLPVPRTLARWLRRLQLVPARPRHQRQGPPLPPRQRMAARSPNDVWPLDFKGWFRTGDGARVFARYGLPKVIRVDNGPPFGGVGPRGLSRLSVWWRRLGIRVEFGRPAHPEDNAAHEQMHGVYQTEVADQPAGHPPGAATPF